MRKPRRPRLSSRFLAALGALFVTFGAGCGARSCDSTPRDAPAASSKAASVPAASSSSASVAGSSSAPPPPPRPLTLAIPRATGPIKLDGELDEDDWKRAARTGAFVDADGQPARPYSEARWLVDAEKLYVGMYAADEDIRARVLDRDGAVLLDDAFSMVLSPREGLSFFFDISAKGVVADARQEGTSGRDLGWQSGIKLGVDADGTPNQPKDDDEEWVIEAAIPLRALELGAGPRRIAARISRCDTPKDGTKRCGAWPGDKGTTTLELP